MTQRHIPMDGTPNFRDLGGYRARDGRQVRYGRLFRSGVLSQLSAADLQTIQALNLVTICDYRRPEETERDPTVLPEKNPPTIVSLPINPGSRSSFFGQLEESGDLQGDALEMDMAVFMVEINRAFALEHQDSFKLMLDEINKLEASQSLLFHCAAGKDRTGFAAALIFMCLDVPRETILEDYMLTEQYFKPDLEISKLQKKYVDYGFDKMDPALIRPMLEVRAEYITSAFDAIDDNFSSTEDFLQSVYGLGPKELSVFREQLLE